VPFYRSWLTTIRVGAAATAIAAGVTAFTVPPAGAATAGWRTVPGPAVAAGASANLTALAMASPSLGWASGFTMANPPVPPMTTLSSVTVTANGQAWAVGTPFISTGRGVILHWTGRAWVTAPAPKTGGSVLLDGVTAVSPGNVWAVGTASADGGPYLPYALHWNGRWWSAVAVPHPGGHGNVVAVGSAGSDTVGRALYGTWNGRGWSLSTGPHITQLNAASFDGRNAIWAVGSENTSGQAFRPVVQVNG
jgi:hypothetical protein